MSARARERESAGNGFIRPRALRFFSRSRIPGLSRSSHLSIIALLALLTTACSDSFEPRDTDPANMEPLPPHQSTPITSNPFAGARLYVDPASPAQKLVHDWASTRPTDADLMRKIANHSKAEWLIDWNADVRPFVDEKTRTITSAGALPVF